LTVAQMFPERPRADAGASERLVHEHLARALDDRFVVFHSLACHGRGKKPDGEVDFLVAHPDPGMLVVETLLHVGTSRAKALLIVVASESVATQPGPQHLEGAPA
jgi:hypothetical protein